MSELLISEQNGLRTLHFGSEWVQGRMRISRPAELMLGYAQDMCAALLLVPAPKQIYVAGLGVGSLPRWALATSIRNPRRTTQTFYRSSLAATPLGGRPLSDAAARAFAPFAVVAAPPG